MKDSFPPIELQSCVVFTMWTEPSESVLGRWGYIYARKVKVPSCPMCMFSGLKIGQMHKKPTSWKDFNSNNSPNDTKHYYPCL